MLNKDNKPEACTVESGQTGITHDIQNIVKKIQKKIKGKTKPINLVM